MASTIAEQLRDAHAQTAVSLDATQRRRLARLRRVRTYRIADSAMLMLAVTTAVIASPGAVTTSDFL